MQSSILLRVAQKALPLAVSFLIIVPRLLHLCSDMLVRQDIAAQILRCGHIMKKCNTDLSSMLHFSCLATLNRHFLLDLLNILMRTCLYRVVFVLLVMCYELDSSSSGFVTVWVLPWMTRDAPSERYTPEVVPSLFSIEDLSYSFTESAFGAVNSVLL